MIPNVTCLTRLFLVVDVTPVTEYTPSGYQSLLLTNLQKLEESEKGESAKNPPRCENIAKKNSMCTCSAWMHP